MNRSDSVLVFLIFGLFLLLSSAQAGFSKQIIAPEKLVSLTVSATTSTPTPTATAQILLASPTARPTLTPLPIPTVNPEELGKSFSGYWFKVVKSLTRDTYWTMKLLKQDGAQIETVATFCVRGSDDNTPNGFYFIVVDRGTVYERARNGYNKVFFPHNFGFKISDRNWYLHPAPWNDQGIEKCPVKSTGGCVNMRPEDFSVLLDGGTYTDPFTKVDSQIPLTGVGTPLIIVPTEETCTYLGKCLTALKCENGSACYQKYVCPFCLDFGSRWGGLKLINPALKSLD